MTKFLIKYFRQNGLPKVVKTTIWTTPHTSREQRGQRVYGFTLISIIHVLCLYRLLKPYYTGTRDIRGSRIGPPYARLEERLEKALVDTRTD